jgi:hypothetical protein
MDTENLDPSEEIIQPTDDLFENVQNLYVGHFERARGSIQTPEEPVSVLMSGEIMLYGHIESETFVIERLRRVALYGSPENPEDQPKASEQIGIFSLAGPLEEPIVTQGSIDKFVEQLHYAALSSKLDPLIEIGDAVFPQVEQIATMLNLEQAGTPDKVAVPLVVSLTSFEPETMILGLIQAITLDPIEVIFNLAGSGSPGHAASHRSLPDKCPPPSPREGDPPPDKDVMRLGIKFVNLTNIPVIPPLDCDDTSLINPLGYLECILRRQIEKVCEVWRNKAALELEVQTEIEEGTQQEKQDYADIDTTDLGYFQSLTLSYKLAKDKQVNNCVEIYLVNSIIHQGGKPTGGGITFDSSLASAFCFLEVAEAQANSSLLAHELGHMLGLIHPDEIPEDMRSSMGSIMEPSPNPPYNPPYNTLYNCRIFDDANIGRLNPIVTAAEPLQKDSYRPDLPSHWIRDFPADDGREPSAQPGQDVWSDSNVWNRQKNRTGGLLASGGPKHEQPLISSQKNFMHVKVDRPPAQTAYVQPVTVELYLAVPGSSSKLRPIGDNYRLTFDTKPPSAIKSLPWIVPPGYPAASCIFAISYSADAPLPTEIINPTSKNFSTVAPLVTRYNCIIQRNMNIQQVTLMNPRSIVTTLPRMQMDNPFDMAAAATLEIDATQAALLDSLGLEVNDQIAGKITPGENVAIQIADYLQPGESRSLRLRATLPSGLRKGTELPIRLRFIVADQFLNGYTHVLRVAPLSSTVTQVLDTLFGALRDVGVGFKSELAQAVAEQARKIMTGEQQLLESPRSVGMRSAVFQPQTAWRSGVTNISEACASLSQSLKTRNDPGYEVVGRKLSELGMLLGNSQGIDDIIFIEDIRDRADRIQQLACGQLWRNRDV